MESLAEENRSIAAALGYNEEGRKWYVYRMSRPSEEKKKLFTELGMQIYVPKLFNYVFVLANRRQVDALSLVDHICPIYNHRIEGEIQPNNKIWLTVPNGQMHILMNALENEEQIEMITPDEQQLEKGDRVLVTSGPFAGLEGVLLTSQGSKGGKVYVSLSKSEGILTAMIPDEYIKVIEFSRNNDHFYRKIEAFEKILDSVFDTYRNEKMLYKEQRSYLQMFLERYDSLVNLTHVNHARLVACQFTALALLGRDQEAEACLRRFEEETAQSKSKRRSSRRSPSAQIYIEKWVQRVKRDLRIS